MEAPARLCTVSEASPQRRAPIYPRSSLYHAICDGSGHKQSTTKTPAREASGPHLGHRSGTPARTPQGGQQRSTSEATRPGLASRATAPPLPGCIFIREKRAATRRATLDGINDAPHTLPAVTWQSPHSPQGTIALFDAYLGKEGYFVGLYGGEGAKNHGYGRSMEYAGKNVVEERFGDGHYRTQETLQDRWNSFAQFCKDQEGTKDMRDVTAETVKDYASNLVDQGYSASTAQNYVSAVNTIMDQARSESGWDKISPKSATGMIRYNVRKEVPSSLDRDKLQEAKASMQEKGQDRTAAVAELARSAGMRMEEAAKADLQRLGREAERSGYISIQEGTKGGRGSPSNQPRQVQATPQVRAAIAQAQAASPQGSRNLIAPGESYKAFKNGELDRGRVTLQQHGVPGYHDARAAYACERYRQDTGHRSPVEAGGREASKEADQAARSVISQELGHSAARTDVTASYLGSAA